MSNIVIFYKNKRPSLLNANRDDLLFVIHLLKLKSIFHFKRKYIILTIDNHNTSIVIV